MLRRALRILALTVLAAVALAPSTAQAKRVKIQWKAIKRAAQYELQITQDGKNVVQQTLDDTVWKGELPFGYYTFQLRAIDRVKRASKWSQPVPLVVMPKPPEPVSPADGSKVVIYDSSASAVLRWNPVPGASKYRVEVSQGGKARFDQVISGTETDLKELPPGKYAWRVYAVIEPAGAPQQKGARRWESEPSGEMDFAIERRELATAKLVDPLDEMKPPADGKVTFKWKDVEGAQAYELLLSPRPKSERPEGRALAAQDEGVRKFTVHGTELVAEVPGEGAYVWQVRALANVDSHDVPRAIGPESIGEFKLDRNAGFFEGGGYVAASTMLAPFSYKAVSPIHGYDGQMDSGAATLRLSGEYYFHPHWGAGLGFDNTLFGVLDNYFDRKSIDAMIKYRFSLGDSKFSWGIAPKFGFEYRELFEITPDPATVNNPSPTLNPATKLSTVGPSIGVDVRKQVSDKLSVGIKLSYFRPVTVSASDTSASLGGNANGRNVAVGAQGLYWLDPRWGLGAGLFYEQRSVSYTTPQSRSPQGGGSLVSEEVYMDGTYFFGSALYRFGN